MARKIKIVGKNNRTNYAKALRQAKVPFSVKKVGKASWEFTIKRR